MKKVIVYTTIGTVLIVLGVFLSPTKANASQTSGRDQITAVNISSMNALVTRLMIKTQKDKDALRTFSILTAMEDGKITQRQAEILDYLEELVPFNKKENVYNALSDNYDVSVDEFLSLREVMEEIGLDVNLYY